MPLDPSRVLVIQGDARHIPLRDQSVHCVVTSIPYWRIRSYGPGAIGMEETPSAFVGAIVEVFREVRRVLRKDGTCWINCGDGYAGGKQGNESTPWHARKGFSVPEKSGDGLKPKDLVGIPWRVALALQADGWWLRSDVIWEKTNPAVAVGRDRPVSSHEYIFLLTRSARYFYDDDAVRTVTGREASWEEYEAALGTNTGANADRLGRGYMKKSGRLIHPLGRGLRDVWRCPSEPSWSGEHGSTFPPALVEPCIKAGCPRGGIVLDPFAGESSAGVAALRHGRRFIGVELSAQHCATSQRRLLELEREMEGVLEVTEDGRPSVRQLRLFGETNHAL